MSLDAKRFPNINVQSYSSVRKKIKSGDLLLCSGSSAISKIIRGATDCVWSHVGFVLRIDNIL